MKKAFLISLLIVMVSSKINAQTPITKQIITDVGFENNKIILNKISCYNYIREGNEFKILDLNNSPLITGTVEKNANDEFVCEVTFVEINKKFSNKKMIGRNGIIFALIDNNVIEKDFKFNKEKLLQFINDYNEIK